MFSFMTHPVRLNRPRPVLPPPPPPPPPPLILPLSRVQKLNSNFTCDYLDGVDICSSEVSSTTDDNTSLLEHRELTPLLSSSNDEDEDDERRLRNLPQDPFPLGLDESKEVDEESTATTTTSNEQLTAPAVIVDHRPTSGITKVDYSIMTFVVDCLLSVKDSLLCYKVSCSFVWYFSIKK